MKDAFTNLLRTRTTAVRQLMGRGTREPVAARTEYLDSLTDRFSDAATRTYPQNWLFKADVGRKSKASSGRQRTQCPGIQLSSRRESLS